MEKVLVRSMQQGHQHSKLQRMLKLKQNLVEHWHQKVVGLYG
jgi:hypothetical protein